jgi:hypothetical protein
MSVTGICDICENRTAEYSCSQCGSNVCAKHYDSEFEACLQCAPSGAGERPDGTPGDDSDVDTFQI